jgi:hypothetical protein
MFSNHQGYLRKLCGGNDVTTKYTLTTEAVLALFSLPEVARLQFTLAQFNMRATTTLTSVEQKGVM